MKLTYIIGGIIVLVIVMYAVINILTSEKTLTDTDTQDVSEIVPSENRAVGSAVETIELTAVGGYVGSGTANRTYDENNFIHLAVAEIGSPADGKFYEGWLVKGGVPVSTGKMTSEDGEYILLFTSETDYSDHNQVVITEETESLGLDGNPETHVLEGTFQ